MKLTVKNQSHYIYKLAAKVWIAACILLLLCECVSTTYVASSGPFNVMPRTTCHISSITGLNHVIKSLQRKLDKEITSKFNQAMFGPSELFAWGESGV